MSAGGERKPDDPEDQTPPNPESGSSHRSEAKAEPSRPMPEAAAGSESASGATEGLPPNQPLPPGAEMLRRASGSSLDSFSDEASDLSLLVAEHFQRRYAHFEVEIGPDGKPVELGRGAMGITYKASDTTLRRPVALKVISSRLLHNESLKNRFLREARAAASLRHPYVASIYYLGSTEASYFYAMELIEGQTLEAFIAQHGPVEVKLALEITAQIASALAAAHQAGLVHRDIKPANIILARDSHGQLTAKVIDFGLVKFATGDIEESSASEPGIFLGTPRYASPEQISCGPVDIRSDLYSVGVTLWQMLTKSAPFMGTPSEVAAQHLQAPLPISKLKYFPQPLVALLTHLLEKDPKDRPQTPEDLLAIVRATQRSLAGHRVAQTIARASVIERKGFLSGRSYIIGGVTALVLAGALGAYFFFHPSIPAAGGGEKSVAVLPFDNVGGDKQNDYLSDGLTTEVIFQLSKIADLRVISRDSVLGYRAAPGIPRKSLNEIGRELNVETVLESSVQRLDQQIKIIAVLYDARTGKRLWGAAYNREMRDLFAIQTDVAENLASALQVRLSPNERDQIQQKPTDNVTAYDLFLQGRAYYLLRHKDDNEKSIELYRQALELDPKFSLGYVGLANAYIDRNVRFGEEAFWVDSAIDLCNRAVAIDPAQARAYVVLSRAYVWKSLFNQAGEAINKALLLAPNDAEVNFRAASQRLASSADSETYSMLRKAYSLDPNDPRKAYLLALFSAVIGENDLREKWMQKTIQLETDADRRKMLECELLAQRRDYQKAFEGLKDLPADAVAYGPSALDLRVECAERLSNWSFVIQATEAKADTDPWAQFHLALTYHLSGDANRAQAEATKLQTQAKSLLSIHPTDRDAIYYLAVSDRILGLREEANDLLRKLFHESISVLPNAVNLLRDDPSLDVFKEDSSFQELMASFDKKDAETRARIAELEKSSPQ
ncbi:MAG: protein kinase [Verrucomicrobia bacterium]|nr:protein kinase [Verrucomicrobiota bacterium]